MLLSEWRQKHNIPTNKKLILKVQEYIYSKDWYTNSLQAIKKKYGIHTDTFIDLLAVTSARTTVKHNLLVADKTLKYKILNKDIDFSYGLANKQIRKNVDKILLGIPYGGQKVNKFAAALKGNLDKVVIDSWMLKAFNINRQSPVTNDIKHITTIIKKLSDKVGIKPAEVQACLWSYAKTELNDSPFKEDNDFSYYLQQTRLDDSIIKEEK